MPTYEKTPSAKLVARREAKIAWNKAEVDRLYAGMADGMIGLVERIAADASAHAPRDPEAAAARGVRMLADTARTAVFADGKLVSGTGERMASRNKPRGARTPAGQVVAFVMFDSPLAHLVELGTVKMAARPFLLPAFNRGVPGVPDAVLSGLHRQLRGRR